MNQYKPPFTITSKVLTENQNVPLIVPKNVPLKRLDM